MEAPEEPAKRFVAAVRRFNRHPKLVAAARRTRERTLGDDELVDSPLHRPRPTRRSCAAQQLVALRGDTPGVLGELGLTRAAGLAAAGRVPGPRPRQGRRRHPLHRPRRLLELGAGGRGPGGDPAAARGQRGDRAADPRPPRRGREAARRRRHGGVLGRPQRHRGRLRGGRAQRARSRSTATGRGCAPGSTSAARARSAATTSASTSTSPPASPRPPSPARSSSPTAFSTRSTPAPSSAKKRRFSAKGAPAGLAAHVIKPAE